MNFSFYELNFPAIMVASFLNQAIGSQLYIYQIEILRKKMEFTNPGLGHYPSSIFDYF
jgi:hypothetical protein